MYSQKPKHIFLKILAVLLVLAALGAGGWYWYDNNVDRSGWHQESGITQYLDFHGKPVTGWLNLEGKAYFFGDNGEMLTGWQYIERQLCYFLPDGSRALGWTQIDGKTHYLREDGEPLVGWQEIDGSTYYFEGECPIVLGLGSGQVHTGWLELDGKRYYLGDDGIRVTGWLDLDEERYYLDETGAALTGPAELDGKSYYFYSDGAVHKGWIDTDEGRKYYDDTGAMITGWAEIEGTERYFDENGILATGWQTVGEYKYYLLEDGTKATSPTEIDGTTCYFTPEGIYVLLVNYNHPVPENYDPDLVPFGSFARVSRIAFDPLTKMINDCKEATGLNVWLNCAYRSFKEQQEIMKERTEEHMENDGLSESAAYQKALETVAVPGYSEHQVGLAMDIVCSGLTDWLIKNCWDYGFILRYPEDKKEITHIAYEHWHFRYVGTEVSLAMKDTGLCLEEYLGAA